MSIANFRIYADCDVDLGWQFQGKGIKSTKAIQIEHATVRINEGLLQLVPDGSHGTKFPHSHGIRNLHEEPNASLECLASAQTLSMLLESAMRGTPTATQASGAIVVTNDGGGYINALVLNGIRPLEEAGNVDVPTGLSWKVYIKVTDGGGGTGHTVSIYKDSGLGAGDLVAEGTGDDLAAVTLAEQNNSGLSGTVTLGNMSGDDVDIEATIKTVTYQFAVLPTRYLSLFWSDGQVVHSIIDVVVKKLSVSSAGKDAVYLIADLLGMDYDDSGALAGTRATLDRSYYVTGDSAIVLEKAAGGTYTIEPESYAVIFDGEGLHAPEVNSNKPTVFLEGMAPIVSTEISMPYSDEAEEIRQQHRTPTVTKDLTYTFIYAHLTLSMGLKNVHWKEANPVEMTHGDPTRDSVGEMGDFGAVGFAKEDIAGSEEPALITLGYDPLV